MRETESGECMIYEHEVIGAVCRYLRRRGFNSFKCLGTKQRGTDLIAVRKKDGTEVHVEAKGGTSSDQTSKCYGDTFTSSQVRDHVAMALLKAAQLGQELRGSRIAVGIAVPDTPLHRRNIQKISLALKRLHVTVFFVSCRTTQVADVSNEPEFL